MLEHTDKRKMGFKCALRGIFETGKRIKDQQYCTDNQNIIS